MIHIRIISGILRLVGILIIALVRYHKYQGIKMFYVFLSMSGELLGAFG